MKADDFKLQLLVAFNVSVLPAIVFGQPWFLVFAVLIVALAVVNRVRHIQAIRRREREELEGPG